MLLVKILFGINLNTLAFGLALMLNVRQMILRMQCYGNACLLSLSMFLLLSLWIVSICCQAAQGAKASTDTAAVTLKQGDQMIKNFAQFLKK